jgi:hypothetical protein
VLWQHAEIIKGGAYDARFDALSLVHHRLLYDGSALMLANIVSSIARLTSQSSMKNDLQPSCS